MRSEGLGVGEEKGDWGKEVEFEWEEEKGGVGESWVVVVFYVGQERECECPLRGDRVL